MSGNKRTVRNQVRKWTSVLLVALLLAIVPIGIARHMLSVSRTEAFVKDQPNYLAHQLPPKGTAELTKKLSGLLTKHLQNVEAVPRIYLARLPEALPETQKIKDKKRLFISSILPLVLRANELIIADRDTLIEIHQKLETGTHLKSTEIVWLKQIAKTYRVKLPKNMDKLSLDHMDRLLFKVDIIPPSLAIAQAAVESAWGTSKFAQKGNAMFGEWVWGDQAKGIIPEQREEGKTHKVKSFDYLLESVRSYMRNLNRHQTYKPLREKRALLRKENRAITGIALASALSKYSERGHAYVEGLISIIEYNDLDILDHASLAKEDVIITPEDLING